MKSTSPQPSPQGGEGEEKSSSRRRAALQVDEILEGIWGSAMVPPDDREIWEWITEEGELPNCYAVPGPFDVSLVPFVKEPLRALRNPAIREVVVQSAVQCLKTLLGEFWLLWSIENAPGPTQWLQPTDEEAREHCEERFLHLVASYPRIARFFTGSRHDRKTAAIVFKHMWMRMEGCGLGNLQRKSVKNQMCSEVWQREHWLPGRLDEAKARLTQFGFNSKRYIESQPGEVLRDQDRKVVGDDILVAYNRWSQEEWSFRCYGCGRLQGYVFNHVRADGTRAGIRWDKTAKTFRVSKEGGFGEPRWGELAQTLRYECIFCGHRHADEPLTRQRMLDGGDYMVGNGDAAPEGRSFSWNQLCMPGIPWLGHVKDWLFGIDQARKGFDLPLRLLFTKKFGKSFDADAHGHFARLPVVDIRIESKAGEAMSIVYEDITFDIPMMGVDVQLNSFFVLNQVWNRDGDILNVWAGELFSWQEVRDKQLEFKVPDEDVLVDSKHRGIEVFQECTRNGHWHLAVRPPEGTTSPQALSPSGEGASARPPGRKVWLCWKAMRGADREYFYWKPSKGRDAGKRIPLVYTWPHDYGNPLMGLRSDDPNRRDLTERMQREEIGRFCPLFTWARPTVMDVALARRDGKGKSKLLTVKGDWNELLTKQWHSQKKVVHRNSFQQTSFRYEKFRADHLLDCFLEIIVRAFQKQILVLESGTG